MMRAAMIAALLWSACGKAPTSPQAAATPTPAPTPTPCLAATQVEYVLSGGPSPDTPIQVDDFLRVYLKGAPLADHCCCCVKPDSPAPPVRFRGSTGDLLRVEAEDGNNCYSVGPIYLQRADGACGRELTARIAGPNCGSEPPRQLFFAHDYLLP
jgi:hypothetical protein